MALTSTEKAKAHRQRLKASGGKQFTVRVSGELMKWINALVEASEGQSTDSQILMSITEEAIINRVNLYTRATEISAAGGSVKDVKRFYNDHHFKIKDINNYIPSSFNKEI
jgi:hypothetical protein